VQGSGARVAPAPTTLPPSAAPPLNIGPAAPATEQVVASRTAPAPQTLDIGPAAPGSQVVASSTGHTLATQPVPIPPVTNAH
jgi:hypothetical protein